MIIKRFEELVDYNKHLYKNKKFLRDEFVDVSKIDNQRVLFALMTFIIGHMQEPTLQVLNVFFVNDCCFDNLRLSAKKTSLQYKTFCRKVEDLVLKKIFYKEQFGRDVVITIHPELYLKVCGVINKIKNE